jgi:hypothetical protein
MRAFLFGVLGAAAAYPLLWRASSPGEERALGVEAPAVAAPTLGSVPDISESPSQRRVTSERLGSSEASEAGIQLPRLPTVNRPTAPLPALPDALERVREVHQVLADPDELAARVQRMHVDASQLAELKAFAEMFVELPPDRVERSLSGATGHVLPAAPARAPAASPGP